MRNKKVGTITLAVGLIALGLLLFANNFTNIAVGEVYKYWPVLLIGVGIEMFVFMIIYKNDENTRIKLDGLCVAFIIIAAIFTSNINGFHFSPKISFNPFQGNMFVDGIKYKSEMKETITRENISKDTEINKLTVRNSFGDVKLQPSTDRAIRVEAYIRVKYNDEQAAREYIKNVVKINEGATTEISSAEYNGVNKSKYSRANIDFVIYVPEGVNAQIDSSFGDINVLGITKDLNIDNQHGDITVRDIGGRVVVRNSFGDIEIDNIAGELQADNQHGDIEAKIVKGNARVETSFGEIQVTDIDGELISKNNYGKINAKNIKGDAQIRTSFGDIDVSYVDGNTIINDNNGSIDALELKGNVEIKNSFGKISYKSSNTEDADIYAKTSFGDIETDLPINLNKAINDQTAQGKTGSGKYRIQLITNNGEIDIK